MRIRNIVLYYISFSVVWIYVTDFVLKMLHINMNTMMFWNTVKGTLYIIISSYFIYRLLVRKKELEDVMREEHRLSSLINAMPDFVNFKDGHGRWIETNTFGLQLFQLEHVDYKGKKGSELAAYTPFYKDILHYCEVSDEETWQAGAITHCEEVVPLPTGGAKIFDTIKVPLFYEDGRRKALVVIGRDITEKKLAKQKLAESQQQYKSLFEYNPDLVYMIDIEGEITNLNPRFEAMTGYKREEFIGQTLLRMIDPKDRERVKRLFREVMQKGVSIDNYEAEIIRKDGTKIILSSTPVPMIINNEIVGIIGYSRDITKIKETEEKLRRTEKLSIVGELAASVAHEIRNPLTSLKGFVQLLQAEADDQVHQTYYQIMLSELDRINHIVSELLVLAKPQQLIFETCDIKTIMNDVITLLNSEANLHGVEISLQMLEEMLSIECEANQLKQLFINLIKNSMEASSTKVDIVVKKVGDHLLIQIKDNGSGIPEERIKHLGEPFFSYKEKGTGLGLTISYRIVESHKGTITFHSELNKGTMVDILLPM